MLTYDPLKMLQHREDKLQQDIQAKKAQLDSAIKQKESNDVSRVPCHAAPFILIAFFSQYARESKLQDISSERKAVEDR